MNVEGWKYYNHAVIPTVAPHVNVDLSFVNNGSIWKIGGNPVLARWTSDYDCGYETQWWYCIKDTPFDISLLPSKKRYEINKGKKNFTVREIVPSEYFQEMYFITGEAYQSWPEKYRPLLEDINQFVQRFQETENNRFFGAFSNESNKLVGYAFTTEYQDYIDFNVLRVIPAYENLSINAAIVCSILEFYNERLSNRQVYILDGSRNINHETAFQNYLEKYFGFRKAYCRLNIAYNPKFAWIIKCAFPFRRVLLKLDNISIIHQMNSVMKMEEIARSFKCRT